jgi:hypothetical protein
MRKVLVWMMTCLLTFAVYPAIAGSYAEDPAIAGSYAMATKAGVIESLEMDTSSIIIGGLRYQVPLDARIEIHGTYGAFTMLEPGMNAVFTYRIIDDHHREITALRTVTTLSASDLS